MEEIGRLLKEKRLELGMTIEEVSDQTRLTQKHIKAMEEGDINFFHDDLSYLRFFVKSYCDVLGLDFDDFKDDLHKSIDAYKNSFTKTTQLTHEEIEKNVAKSERLSEVQKSKKKQKTKRRLHKPDMSLVSLIAVVAVVAIVIMFAFVVFLKSDVGKEEVVKTPQPVAPEQTESGENKYPSSEEKEQEEEKEEETKEISISKTDATHYTIENMKDGDELTFEVTFAGSSAGFSASVDGEVLDEPKAQVYEYNSTAKGNVKVKKGMKLELYVGYMYDTQLKINGKNVKLDDSIVKSSGAITLEFTIVGDSDESAQ